jgi:hypothetical protein
MAAGAIPWYASSSNTELADDDPLTNQAIAGSKRQEVGGIPTRTVGGVTGRISKFFSAPACRELQQKVVRET